MRQAKVYRAVLMVDHPSATTQIDHAKTQASPAARIELERLARRLEANRLRARP